MDAADPLCAISSTTLLLARTLGPAPASATEPSASKTRDALLEAIAVARSLKGSAELVKQAKMVLKEHRDIQNLYQNGAEEANGSKEQQGRRPGLNRKRARFTMKDTASEPMPLVDRSKLANIQDPVEYFMALERLEEADEEIKRLNGVTEKHVWNFDPVHVPKRQPGFRGRKSVRSFKVIEDADTQDPIEVPASQAATMTGSQLSQDVMHAVADKNEQCVPSSSAEAISDVSGKEDSLEKDCHDDFTCVLTSLEDVDESEEQEFFLKTLGIREIRKERVSLRRSIPGVRSPSSYTKQKGSMGVHPPESPLSQSRQARISELEKQLFSRDPANDKCTDDKSEGSPDVVMDEPSLVQGSMRVHPLESPLPQSCQDRVSELEKQLFSRGPASPLSQSRQARISELEKQLFSRDPANDKCTDDKSEGSPDVVMDEPSLVQGSMRIHPLESPLPQSCQDRISELEKQLFSRGPANDKCTDDESEGSPDVVMNEPSLVHDASDLPMTVENFTGSEIDRETPNLGARAADHSLDPEQYLPDHAYERQPGGSSVGLSRDTEVAKENEACGRSNISVEFELQEDNVPIDYEKEASSHHQEGSSTEELVNKPGRHAAPDGIDGILHADEDIIQPLEVVKEGVVLQDKSSQSLKVPLKDIDPVNEPQMHDGSSKKKQQAAQKGKMKKQSKRGKKATDEPSHALETPQCYNDDVNIEQQKVMSSKLSPNGAKEQQGAQRRNKTQKLNQRKTTVTVTSNNCAPLGDAGLGVRRSSRTRSRPLDYWLGERLLYGPINDTLPAVIGIKAYSPGQDGKRTLKVKSFVPEEYSVLVDKSSRY